MSVRSGLGRVEQILKPVEDLLLGVDPEVAGDVALRRLPVSLHVSKL